MGPNRRYIVKAMLAAGGTLAAGLPARQGLAAGSGLSRLREGVAELPPGLVMQDAEGQDRSPADFAGKGLVLNLWATWCAPCVAEMPALDRLAALVAADGIRVVPLSSDRGGRNAVQGFYERTGVRNLGIWLDPRGAAARALGARGLPTTIIIDRAGRERARLEGDAAWDAPDLVAAVRRLTAAQQAATSAT